MGRNLMEKAGRGAMDVPSVCKMEATDGQGVLVDAKGQTKPMCWDTNAETPRFGSAGKKERQRPQTAAI
jgi:hypothetical protein